MRIQLTGVVLLALSLAWCSIPLAPSDEEALPQPGNVYYVAPTGDDTYPGSKAQPWQTIQKAATTLVAGETVYIRAGTYQERVVPQNSGSDQHAITYAAYPGETVTIDGTGIAVPTDEGLFHISGKSQLRLSGVSVINSAYA